MDLRWSQSKRLNPYQRREGHDKSNVFLCENDTNPRAISKFWQIDCQRTGTLIEAIATCDAEIMKQILTIKNTEHPFTAVVYKESAPLQNGPTMQCRDFSHEPDNDECHTVYHVRGLLKFHGSGTNEQALRKQFSENVEVHALELKCHVDRWIFSAISEKCFLESSETRTAMFTCTC